MTSHPGVPAFLVELHDRLDDDEKLAEAKRRVHLLRERLKAKCDDRALDAFEQFEAAVEARRERVLDLVVDYFLVGDDPDGAGNIQTLLAERMLDAPLAVTSTGHVLLGATHATGEREDPRRALGLSLMTRRQVFLGLVVGADELPSLLRQVDDAGAEIVSRVDYRARG